MEPGFKDSDPAHIGFQYIEDISNGYWYSQILFTALELKLFMHIDQGNTSLESLAGAASCHEDELFRLLRCLERMGLLLSHKDCWFNTQASAAFLVPGKESHMGEFFLYRKYMAPQWNTLTKKVAKIPLASLTPKLDYAGRNALYVKAMDTLARQKAMEIARVLTRSGNGWIQGTVLDLGGGGGSMVRALKKEGAHFSAVLFELPEVIQEAKKIYPDKKDWEGISTLSGDFRTHEFDDRFSLIIMGNFLHAYGPEEARVLLEKAVGLLAPKGKILIHDYFPDRQGVTPQKGALYDLAMMLNTFNGACHEACKLALWLEESGLGHIEMADLSTDSSIILAGGDASVHINKEPWVDMARDSGFDLARAISPAQVITAPWVEMKCRFGCRGYGKNHQCPPGGLSYKETRTLLDSYTQAVLVQGTPPGRAFHDQLLSLEKQAFLAGFHKALVFGAGPCPICPECSVGRECRHHDLARPAMESCGIDVYSTLERAGMSLKPVQEKGQYVKYIGLLLLE